PADIMSVGTIASAAIILIQLEIPIETITAIAKIAKINQQKLIINPAPALPLGDEILNGLFLLTPNETEASLLTGINVEDAAMWHL
ncbi:MAG: PfkB family carbohydrate kinase, partial [Chitinophagaceae bacterium]